MADNNEGLFQVNTPCILGHPHLTEPVAFKDPKTKKPKGDPKYSGIFVFKNDHPDLAGLKAKILEVAKAKWPDKNIVEEAKAGNLKMPFANGDKLADKRVAKLKAAGKEDDGKGDFQRGCTVFKSASMFPPGLGVVVNKAIVDITDDNKAVHKGKFYFGTDCLVTFNFKAYDAISEDAKPGVTAYLTMCVSLNRGKKLSGQRSSAEAFKGVAGLASMDDPTAGGAGELDDEVPF